MAHAGGRRGVLHYKIAIAHAVWLLLWLGLLEDGTMSRMQVAGGRRELLGLHSDNRAVTAHGVQLLLYIMSYILGA